MWKRVSAIFCESERIPQNTNRIHVFSKSSHRIRRPSEYHARIPRRIRAEYTKEYRILHRIQNTAKNTVSYMQNTRRIRGSQRFERLRFFVGSSSMMVTVHLSVSIGLPSPSRGGDTTLAPATFASALASALLTFLLTASLVMPAPLPSSFCFPAALVVFFFFSCRQWEVGVRERRPHMRGREDSMHCEL